MSDLKISPVGKVVFISGANRGIGKALAIALLEKGAKKVYAGARNPRSLNEIVSHYGDRLIPVQLDVTDQSSINQAAKIAHDVQILINNAGVLRPGGFFSKDAVPSFEIQLNVNVWGLLNLSRAFIDTLKKNRPAAIINISSLAGLGNMPVIGTYSASKSAVHSITQGMRAELSSTPMLVIGVYPGPIDTDMTQGLELEKDSPENVAKDVIQALMDGNEDVFPDLMSKQVGEHYGRNPKAIEKEFGQYTG